MSFKAAINRGFKKPHIRLGLKVYKSVHPGQDYNNEMAVQFCYSQLRKKREKKESLKPI